jgi:hypothetical protein
MGPAVPSLVYMLSLNHTYSIPRGGRFPEEDEAHFDGWYSDKSEACLNSLKTGSGDIRHRGSSHLIQQHQARWAASPTWVTACPTFRLTFATPRQAASIALIPDGSAKPAIERRAARRLNCGEQSLSVGSNGASDRTTSQSIRCWLAALWAALGMIDEIPKESRHGAIRPWVLSATASHRGVAQPCDWYLELQRVNRCPGPER